MAAKKPERRRLRALVLLRHLGAFVLLLAVFAGALAAGVALHIDLPASRRVVADTLTDVLSNELQGGLQIESIRTIEADLIELDEFRLRDTEGEEVVTLKKVRLHADVPSFLYKLFLGEGRVTLVINHIRAERTEWNLKPDPKTGEPSFVSALAPVERPDAKKPDPDEEPRRVRTWIPTIEIGSVFARGKVGELPMLEASLTNVKGSLLASPKGLAIDVQRFGASIRGLGGTDARGTGDLHIRAPGKVWTHFNGAFGDVQVGTYLETKGKELRVKLDVPRARPADVRAIFVDWPVQQDVSGRIEVSGELPTLDAKANLDVGKTKVGVDGTVTVSGEVAARLDVDTKKTDLRVVFPDAPATEIDASTRIELWTQKEEVKLQVNGRTEATTIAGIEVPVVDWKGKVDKTGFDGTATIMEPGVPLRTDVRVKPDGVVDLGVQVKPFRLAGSPRLRRHVSGNASLDVKATIADQRFVASYQSTVAGFSVGKVKLGGGTVSGTAKGPLADLQKVDIRATLKGRGLTVPFWPRDVKFGRVQVTATGRLLKPAIDLRLAEGPTNVRVKGVLSPPIKSSTTTIEDLDIRLHNVKDDIKVKGEAKRFDFKSSSLAVNNVSFKGAGGELKGSLALSPRSLRAKLLGTNVDLGKLSRAIGVREGSIEGVGRIDADLKVDREKAEGHIRFGMGGISYQNGDYEGISAQLDANFDGKRAWGNAQGSWAEVLGAGAVWDARIGGSPMDPEAWKGALGTALVRVHDITLTPLSFVHPEVKLVEGKAWAKLQIERRKVENLPTVIYAAGTHNLAITIRDPLSDDERAKIKYGNAGLQVAGVLSGANGELSGQANLDDAEGSLLQVKGTAQLPLREWIAKPKTIVRGLLQAPLNLNFELMERPFERLPQPFALRRVRGSLHAKLNLQGSVSEPRAAMAANLSGVVPRRSRLAQPANVQTAASYDAKDGKYSFSGGLQVKGRRVAWTSVTGSAPWDYLRGAKRAEEGVAWWNLDSTTRLDDFPLESFEPFADADVQGRVSGTMTARRVRGTPLIVANFALRDPVVDRVALGSGKLRLSSDGGVGRANFELQSGKGNLEIAANAPLDWRGAVPNLDAEKGLRVTLKSKDFDAVVLQPFLGEVLSRVSGMVNADLQLDLTKPPAPEKDPDDEPSDDDEEPEQPWKASLSGTARMREGLLQVAKMGLDLEELSFDVRATANEQGSVVRIRDVKARARAERPNVRGGAELEFKGLSLQKGSGTLKLDEVPILLEGVSQGDGTGFASFELERSTDSLGPQLSCSPGTEPREAEERLQMKITVPEFEAKLPRSSSRQAFELRDNPDIKILQQIKEPRLRDPEEEPPLPWVIELELGDDVRVTRADGMEVYFGGKPTACVGEEFEMRGFIELTRGGRIPTLNKGFAIERGLVSFDTGDSTNPRLSVSASWRAPNDTRLYVDVTGTLRQADIALRSDPPLSQPEIYKLLLGGVEGSTETASRQPGSEDDGSLTGDTAVSVGGGVAFMTLNELLTGTDLQGVSLSTEKSEDSRSWSAGYRANSKLYFEGTFQDVEDSGVDDSGRDGVSGTVEYRFLPDWSLRTQVGSTGTAVDLLWQYRY